MSDAFDNLKSAYQLLSMAENLTESVADFEANKTALTINGENLINVTNVIQETEDTDSNATTKIIVILLLGLALSTIIIIILYKKYKHTTVYDTALSFTDYQTYKIKELMIDLDRKFLRAKINEKTYRELMDKYRIELNKLEEKKIEILRVMTDIESMESELHYLQNKLDTTTSLFKKNIINETEYRKRITDYKKEISGLKYEIKEDEGKIVKTMEKKKLNNNKKQSAKKK